MTLQMILSRYTGYGIVIYGGDKVFVDDISKTHIVVSWMNEYNMSLPTPSDIPDKLIQVIVNNTGYVDGKRVEMMTMSYLTSVSAIIYHGYPEFKTAGLDVIKEVYSGGCLISPMIGEVYRLQKVSSLLPESIPIPVPFVYDEDMNVLLPYTHIYSRLEDIKKEEGVLRIPIDDIPSQLEKKTMDTIYTSSVYVDKDRKLLLAAIDLALRASDNFILLYYGDLYIKWLPQFIELFLSKHPSIHLWGKDQGVDIPSHTVVRPPDLGDERPSIEKYIAKYGRNNNIIILADEDDTDLLGINPIAAYIPYNTNMPGTVTITPWTTLGRANILYLRGDTKISDITQENINYFHYHTRTNSYNIGKMIDTSMEIISDIGRYIPIPSLGLCTCYDCVSEVGIMSRYMKGMDIPFDIETLKGLLIYNGPSLWSISRPISRPRDRKNILISTDNIDKILDLDIYMYANIGIGVTEEQLSSTSLYIGGNLSPTEYMKDILQGKHYPLIVNFHRDFMRNYNPDTDKGRTGKKKYDKFLQDVALNRSSLDTWSLLLLFILSR